MAIIHNELILVQKYKDQVVKLFTDIQLMDMANMALE